jgi:CheY-specific phosphatase CheX
MAPSDQLEKVFIESASEVLETMFFVGVLGENTESATPDPVSAELIFNGEPSGRFGVRVPSPTGRLIAANFLGKEEEAVSGTEIEQVICELTNMICGSVLSRIEAGARFQLLHPEITRVGADTCHPKAASLSLQLEGGLINLWMAFEAIAPAAKAY